MSDVAKKQQNSTPTPTPAPIALTIAGSDSSGGAGLQADLKTFAAFGVFGASAITAATAQNTATVSDVRVFDPEFVDAQIRACTQDLPIAAIKTGMLANAGVTRAVAAALADIRTAGGVPPMVVVDPVMIATSGASLLDRQAVTTLIEELMPLANLITPNLPEAAALTGCAPGTDAEKMGARLLDLGAGAVLIKGGHADGRTCRDLLLTPEVSTTFEWPRAAGEYHGTGCAYAAAIAALSARGLPLGTAVERAGAWLQEQIAGAFQPLHGRLRVLPFTRSGD